MRAVMERQFDDCRQRGSAHSLARYWVDHRFRLLQSLSARSPKLRATGQFSAK
jgi:hypothetical protein